MERVCSSNRVVETGGGRRGAAPTLVSWVGLVGIVDAMGWGATHALQLMVGSVSETEALNQGRLRCVKVENRLPSSILTTATLIHHDTRPQALSPWPLR